MNTTPYCICISHIQPHLVKRDFMKAPFLGATAYAYTHTHTRAHTHTYTHKYLCHAGWARTKSGAVCAVELPLIGASAYTHTHTLSLSHTHTHRHTRTNTHTHTHTHKHTLTHSHTHIITPCRVSANWKRGSLCCRSAVRGCLCSWLYTWIGTLSISTAVFMATRYISFTCMQGSFTYIEASFAYE